MCVFFLYESLRATSEYQAAEVLVSSRFLAGKYFLRTSFLFGRSVPGTKPGKRHHHPVPPRLPSRIQTNLLFLGFCAKCTIDLFSPISNLQNENPIYRCLIGVCYFRYTHEKSRPIDFRGRSEGMRDLYRSIDFFLSVLSSRKSLFSHWLKDGLRR